MKYEIIFKSGKIKNVISKDVNKIKNYITESFNNIKSVKRLDEADKNDINSLSEKEKIKLVKEDGWNIRFIKNPSEKLQLIAIKPASYNIQFIKNPTEKVQLLAVKKEDSAIKLIENPTEKVKQLYKKLTGKTYTPKSNTHKSHNVAKNVCECGKKTKYTLEDRLERDPSLSSSMVDEILDMSKEDPSFYICKDCYQDIINNYKDEDIDDSWDSEEFN